jgi:hypothetical protein
MTLYVFDLIGKDTNTDTYDDMDMYFRINEHRYLFRSYTTNQFVINQYAKFIQSVFGDYATYQIYEFDLERYIRLGVIDEDATDITGEQFDIIMSDIVDRMDGKSPFGALMSEINTFQTEWGVPLYCPEDLENHIAESAFDMYDVIEVIVGLFSNINKYVLDMSTYPLTEFRAMIINRIPEIIKDPYADMDFIYILRWYIVTLRVLE